MFFRGLGRLRGLLDVPSALLSLREHSRSHWSQNVPRDIPGRRGWNSVGKGVMHPHLGGVRGLEGLRGLTLGHCRLLVGAGVLQEEVPTASVIVVVGVSTDREEFSAPC